MKVDIGLHQLNSSNSRFKFAQKVNIVGNPRVEEGHFKDLMEKKGSSIIRYLSYHVCGFIVIGFHSFALFKNLLELVQSVDNNPIQPFR